MRTLYFWLFLTISQSLLFAQVRPDAPRWGHVSSEYAALTSCPFDTSAAAVVLSDVGSWQNYSLEDGTLAFSRHVRIKILKPDALDIAEVVLRFRGQTGEEQIRNLEAQTLNYRERWPHWERIPLALEHLPGKKVDEVYSEKRFTFRDVKVGSIIEYRYSLITPDFETLRPWHFQREIPTLYSDIRLSGFESGEYLVASTGRHTAEYLRGTKRYIRKNIPALTPAPYGPGAGTERIGLHFQFTYQPSIQQMLGYVYYYGVKNDVTDSLQWHFFNENLEYLSRFSETEQNYTALQSLVRSLIEEDSSHQGRIDAIFYHLNRYMRWDGQYSRQVWRSPSAIYRSQRGSSAELNLLLLEMLTLAGIPARKCFIATQDHSPYFVQKPILTQFNHVLVLVPSTENHQAFVLDLTQPFARPGFPPSDCLPSVGYIPWGADSGWTAVPPPAMTSTQISYVWKAHGDTAHLEIQGVPEGYVAQNLRKQWALSATTGDFWQQLADSLPGVWSHQSGEFQPGIRPGELTLLQGSFIQELAQPRRIALKPLEWLTQAPPFIDSNSDRSATYFRYPREFTYRFEIQIPEGYRVAETIPTRLHQTSEKELVCELRSEQRDGKLILTANWAINQPTLPGTHQHEVIAFSQAAWLTWKSASVVLEKQ